MDFRTTLVCIASTLLVSGHVHAQLTADSCLLLDDERNLDAALLHRTNSISLDADEACFVDMCGRIRVVIDDALIQFFDYLEPDSVVITRYPDADEIRVSRSMDERAMDLITSWWSGCDHTRPGRRNCGWLSSYFDASPTVYSRAHFDYENQVTTRLECIHSEAKSCCSANLRFEVDPRGPPLYCYSHEECEWILFEWVTVE